MILERIKTPGLAHVCYLLGDGGKGVVVDPGRVIDEILTRAQNVGVTIEYIVETHRQEDFVIGAAPLAEATGAKIVVGRDPHFGHGDILLGDGEEITVGSMTLRALHTPGHTPESMCYAVFLEDTGDTAWGVFTGDTLFIGEAGRTDLPDPARTAEAAGELYDAVHAKLVPLGDQVLILSAHGSGSLCGGSIADRDHSSLGLERVSNPVFLRTREEFIRSKVEERIPRPPYFAHMEKVNARGGAPVAIAAAQVKVLQPKDFESESRQSIVIDTRSPEAYAAGHLPGSYSVWADGLVVFARWIAGPGTNVYLVSESVDTPTLDQAVLSLARVGVDQVKGVLAKGFEAWRDAGLPVETIETTTPRALADSEAAVLDVRDDGEFEKGHIADAAHLYVGYLDTDAGRLAPLLAKDAEVVVTCGVGHRASSRRACSNVPATRA